jgi:hypothetical protein
MKSVFEVIDFFNKTDQNYYVELNYDNEWSFIRKKVKDFVKKLETIKNKNKCYTIIDFDDNLYYCDEIKEINGTIIIYLKKLTNDYFLNEFESLASSANGL